MNKIKISIAVLCLSLGLNTNAFSQNRSIPLGSGKLGGSDHAAGSVLCRLNNTATSSAKSNCVAMISKGSVYNLNKLRSGEFQVVLATPGTAAASYAGNEPFQSAGPHKELRALFSLSPSFLMLIVNKNSSINKFEDIRGKRIYADLSGSSSTSFLLQEILTAFKINKNEFQLAPDMPFETQSKALCKGEIEAFAANTGAGAKYISDALACGARLVPIAGPQAKELAKNSKALRMGIIPADTYDGQTGATKTLTETDTIVTTTQLSTEEAYNIVKSVFENLNEVKKSHLAFKNIDPNTMSKEALGVPLHEGALRYFKEKGLAS